VTKPDFDPNDPAGAGFQLVFDDEFNDASTIDLSNSCAAGFKWYLRDSFIQKATPASNVSVKYGLLTIGGSGGDIQTICRTPGQQRFVGQAFGGSAFFEARLAFKPTPVVPGNGWPSFWGLSLNHSIDSDQWPGQMKGYTHFIEDDFFEYDTAQSGDMYSYGSAIHDWYGIWGTNCKSFCQIFNTDNFRVRVKTGTKWNQFHVISQLWLAGTKTNGGVGRIVNYFDGKPTTAYASWRDSDEGAPPPSGAFTFSVLDKDRLVIFLSAGKTEPMRVDWVHVWQTVSASQNDNNHPIEPQKGFSGGNGSCTPAR
jgi:hypothetical protein